MDAELEKIKKLYPGYDDVEINPTSFGARLRQIRKERGETQDEFAAIIETSKQALSRYESGQRIPKISLAEKYAKALGVSVDYLLGKEVQQQEETMKLDETEQFLIETFRKLNAAGKAKVIQTAMNEADKVE